MNKQSVRRRAAGLETNGALSAVSIIKKRLFKKRFLDITWNIVDPRALIAKHKQKPINGIVEQIQDENSINVFLLPDFDHVSVTFEKVRLQIFKRFKLL